MGLDPGSNALTGWVIGGSTFVVWSKDPAFAQDGSFYITFASLNGTISQAIATIPGELYTLSFYANAPVDRYEPRSIGIDVPGHSYFVNSTTGWDLINVPAFTATTTTSTITFTGLRSGLDGYFGYLDNINVDGKANNVPIPGAIWLLGSGLIGLAGLRRKFQK